MEDGNVNAHARGSYSYHCFFANNDLSMVENCVAVGNNRQLAAFLTAHALLDSQRETMRARPKMKHVWKFS